ncbi:hypothetical protein PsorP6_011211 [Peronosclerospora sorghi]|uniref:Uncharacterized protein n=1 Tax=Peronosclerospora sorghi TaxID=230839 RepID=A0ACC0VX35_9STRA|nr:hypothetical protein PsorP6_011211 [Peronosclerospora sorghi]
MDLVYDQRGPLIETAITLSGNFMYDDVDNKETLGQTKQRHKLELRKAKKDRLSKNLGGSDGNTLKERHNQELKAFEREEENTTSLISHTNEAAEAASLSTKQAKPQAKAQRKRENKKKSGKRTTRTHR